MTTYLELSKTYQEQVLGMIEQSQKLTVDSVSAWAKAAQPLAKSAPARPRSRASSRRRSSSTTPTASPRSC